ncbi:MAG TPA: dienelactone hydrolase family protein [Hyphomicrobiales bacterium]|nr:dienelactone hydrolase family protein [Hyphomicrobiales bacterium]
MNVEASQDTGMIEVGAARDGPFAAYRAVPASGRGPGIVLASEMFGVTAAMKLAADGFAARGFPTYVPNLFWRYEPAGVLGYEGEDRATAFARLERFDTDDAVADVRTTATALRKEASCDGRVVALGFCVGGRIAGAAAVEGAVDAAVGLYGLGVSRYGERLATLKTPLQLHYGLNDQHVPAEEIEAVRRLAAGNPNVDVHLYPGAGHSFANPMRPTYDKAAAELAIDRALAFLSARG